MKYVIITENEEVIALAKEKECQIIPVECSHECECIESETDTIPREKEESDIKLKVYNFLKALGIPAHLLGNTYIRYALVNDIPHTLITKQFYPPIAKAFETTPERVERAIRTAIEVSYQRGNMDLYEKVFGYTIEANRSKPTNQQFIAGCKQYLEFVNR